jgi:hypothetical protein
MLEEAVPHSLTLPIAAGVAIVGSAGGIWLGNSSISQINPAYYSDPETRFHADLAAQPPNWEQAQVAGTEGTADGLGTGCIKCRDYPEEVYPSAAAYYREPNWSDPSWRQVDGEEDGWAASAPETEVRVVRASAEADPEMERVQTYSAYRVSADEPTEQAFAPEDDEDQPAEETDGL